MTQRTALITGVTGQDGSYLAELLVAKGYRVVGTTRPGRTETPANLAAVRDRVELVPADLADEAALRRLLGEFKPDEVYNLAAMSFSPDCEADPVGAGEVLGLNVARLLAAAQAATPTVRVFQASSSEMYGQPERSPQDEATPFRPLTAYGVAKLFAHAAAGLWRRRGLFVSCGILFSHESPRRRPEFVTRKVCRAAARIARGLEREVHLGDLDAVRDWSWAGDVVEAMWLSLQAEEGDDYVVASGETHSIRELCEAAFAAAGRDWRDHVVADPALARKEHARIVGDAGRARERLGWRPRVAFPEMVRLMVRAELDALDAAGLEGRK